MLSNLPSGERPRERLSRLGPQALSLVELLAICIGSGCQDQSALEVACSLLLAFEDLSQLASATLGELMAIKGIGRVKAIQLQAIFTLIEQWPRSGGGAKYLVRSPEDVFIFSHPYFQNVRKEVLLIVLRDKKGFLYHHEVVAIGTLDELISHPREILRHAIIHSAHSFILVHNHPSGDPTPSRQDILFTQAFQRTSQMMGIKFDDHLVIGKVSYVSLWDRGYFSHMRY